MEGNAYLASIFAGAFYLVASVRLLRLSRQTGEQPELLLGMYFAFSGLYYFGYNLPNLFGFDQWAPSAEWIIEWIYVMGVFPYLYFIRAVFRPEDAWASATVGICSVLLLVGTVMGALDGHAVYSFDSPWFLVQWVGYTAPCVWMGLEALLSRHSARKRVRIGLCAPIVANRYTLFALFGGFQTLACLADLSFAAEVSNNQAVSLISEALLGGSEIASIAVLWLAFFPPRSYTNWVNRRAPIMPTPMEG